MQDDLLSRLRSRYTRMEPEGDGWSWEEITDPLILETCKEITDLREALENLLDAFIDVYWNDRRMPLSYLNRQDYLDDYDRAHYLIHGRWSDAGTF